MKERKSSPGYDIIGDIHGYADELCDLLARLGYHERNGIYQHPERRVVFVGDFIDRGPKIRKTLQIVRAMVDAGSARAVMGNHEFNALCYDQKKAEGGFLREHSAKNMQQHKATLDQFVGHDLEWRECLDWFLTLPLWIDEPGFRVIHACWSEPHRKALCATHLTRELLTPASTRGTPEFEAVEALIKGIEFNLPAGSDWIDKDGHVRDSTRVKWWQKAHGRTYREMTFPEIVEMPDHPVPDEEADKLMPYRALKPVFFGHYWMPESSPKEPVAPNLACVDFSVAKGGSLVAYRWDGESTLSPDKFTFVAAK